MPSLEWPARGCNIALRGDSFWPRAPPFLGFAERSRSADGPAQRVFPLSPNCVPNGGQPAHIPVGRERARQSCFRLESTRANRCPRFVPPFPGHDCHTLQPCQNPCGSRTAKPSSAKRLRSRDGRGRWPSPQRSVRAGALVPHGRSLHRLDIGSQARSGYRPFPDHRGLTIFRKLRRSVRKAPLIWGFASPNKSPRDLASVGPDRLDPPTGFVLRLPAHVRQMEAPHRTFQPRTSLAPAYTVSALRTVPDHLLSPDRPRPNGSRRTLWLLVSVALLFSKWSCRQRHQGEIFPARLSVALGH